MHTEGGRVGVGFVAACESEVEHLWLAPVGGGCESWPPAWEDTLFPLPFRSSVLGPQPPVSGSGGGGWRWGGVRKGGESICFRWVVWQLAFPSVAGWDLVWGHWIREGPSSRLAADSAFQKPLIVLPMPMGVLEVRDEGGEAGVWALPRVRSLLSDGPAPLLGRSQRWDACCSSPSLPIAMG